VSENTDPSQKTEDATPRKLLEAREKGQVLTSQEVSHLAIMISGALIAGVFGPFMATKIFNVSGGLLQNIHAIQLDAANIGNVFFDILFQLALGIGPAILVLMALGILAKLSVSGFVFSSESLNPKLERLSPVKGFTRLVSIKSLVEFAKGLVKLSIVGGIVGMVAVPVLGRVELLMQMDIAQTANEARLLITQMFVVAIFVMGIIAGLDYLYQRYEFLKQMKMSMQEVKDEVKQSDGDPLVKGRLRQIRADRARARMMAAVPTADVVVTNPTHFAIALKYESEVMSAPKVVAKGVDEVAFRIRDVATENDIPIIENPPLARALFATADIDDEIPSEHYKAVAEIISFVFKLKNKNLN
jgi:flagellar biosynthetic protein FlhB